MSIFGTNQVEEVIIGDAVATESTVQDFIASASEKEIKALPYTGDGKSFYLVQKTGGNASRGLNFEFSQAIESKRIERIVATAYAPEVQKTVKVTGFTSDNVLPNKTYAVSIRLYNESGSVSPENFRILSGYYSTGASVDGVTADTVRDGVVAALNTELKSRGDNEFTVSTEAGAVVITGAYQPVRAGKDEGRQIQFDVIGKVIDQNQENLGLLKTELVTENHPGHGTAKQVINKEWFVKGFKYEPYRGMSYPVDFDTPYYADPAGQYNAVIITYKSARISPTVEEQQKVLIIYVKANEGNAATNALLADLREFVPEGVPADLPTE